MQVQQNTVFMLSLMAEVHNQYKTLNQLQKFVNRIIVNLTCLNSVIQLDIFNYLPYSQHIERTS